MPEPALEDNENLVNSMPGGELVYDLLPHDFVTLMKLWRDCGIPLEQGEEWETTILQAFPDLRHGLNLVKWKDAK